MARPSKLTAALLTLIFTVLAAGFLLSTPGLTGRTQPVAERGVINLANWNFAEMGAVALDGEWSFYQQELLTPDSLTALEGAPVEFLRMPGPWKHIGPGSKPFPNANFGTLRLRVHLPENDRRLAMNLPPIYSAYRLWANGRLVAEAGTVGTSADTGHPQYRPQFAILEAGAPTLDLVLQVSGFHHRLSGSVSSISLGTYETILLAKRRASVIQAGLIGALAFLGLQSLFLFLGRRQPRAHFVGGSFILLGALLVAVAYDLIFADLSPGFGWEVHWKIVFIGNFMLLILAMWLVRILFPRESSFTLQFITSLLAGAGVTFVVFTPAQTFTSLQPVLHVLSGLTVFYLLAVGIRGIEKSRPMSWTFMLTALALAAWMTAVWPRYYGLPRADAWLSPIPMVAVLLGLVAIFLLEHGRLADTRSALEDENAALTGKLQSRVLELRAARRLLASQDEELHRQIAEFLHSRVQSKLLVVGFHLNQAAQWLSTDRAGAVAALVFTRNQLDQIREKEIRLVSHLLHPPAITIGLVPSVQSLAAEYNSHFCTNITVSPAVAELDSIAGSRIPERVRTAVYRVLSEALANAQVHAEATEVCITVSLAPDLHLVLEITDNGCGFDTASVAPGLGLRTIAARLAECEGTVEWESKPGRGTRLRIRIPLDANANSDPE
ncbi:MAG TPA: sigma-E processing peptidase SpoIIGA [Symbiobacteriaceae bacterium]|nr:sigma-E processing peptidase SpoIIGA [Symbiobacteriaceae bacterium]